MTEYRGGPPGAHYSSDSEFHCRGCGVGLATGEACSMKGCPRYGRRANGQAAGGDLLPGDPTPASWLQGLVRNGRHIAPLFDASVREGIDHGRRIEAETEQRAMYRELDDGFSALRWLGEHPCVNEGPQ